MSQEKCLVCDVIPGEEIDGVHLNSEIHRFNYMLYEWKTRKNRLMSDRHGIVITVSLLNVSNILKDVLKFSASGTGEYLLEITPEELCALRGTSLEFCCVVKNTRSDTVYITSAGILLNYQLYDMRILSYPVSLPEFASRTVYRLNAGHSFEANVQYKIESFGVSNYEIPIYFTIQTEHGKHSATFARNIIVSVAYNIFEICLQADASPFTGNEWDKQIRPKPPVGNLKMEFYPIPPKMLQCLKCGLKPNPNYDDVLRQIKRQLEPEHVTATNYKDFFHILLWLEEIKLAFMLGSYTMEKVTLTSAGINMFNLTVPGLAEKRPSVVKGDYIDVKISDTTEAYRGIVENVNDETIDITKFDKNFSEYLENHPETVIDVRFLLGRICLDRMHEGVKQVTDKKIVYSLFPDVRLVEKTVCETIQLTDQDFINKTVAKNMEQRTAVMKILNRTSGDAPYIVYGPPGTGKTVTIVEAILQLKRKTNKSILICAPANAACNMLAEKLQPYCTENELIRVMSDTADAGQVPDKIKNYVKTNVSHDKVRKYRLVVTTLILAGKYSNQQYHPDIVFIDEAAQPLEPEACCAIGLLERGQQIVLAGDPFQLGPNVKSKLAEKYGLGISLLERLVNSELYKTENPNFITMLKDNYRSHELILSIPNKLFYEEKLKAISYEANNDPLSKVNVYKNTVKTNKTSKQLLPGHPLEFCAVLAKEQREGKSPSYFNCKEIEMVIRYVDALTSLPLNNGKRIEESDIGVVTPYIRQVYKIKEKLSLKNPEVEVGTTETFQGREKRVIIVSTVRAQESLLLYDKMYDLGFVKHDKRFNVAVTRAMSKLIVIGNPAVLQKDAKWLEYIELCINIGTYGGAPFPSLDRQFKSSVSRLVASINIDDSQYQKNNEKTKNSQKSKKK